MKTEYRWKTNNTAETLKKTEIMWQFDRMHEEVKWSITKNSWKFSIWVSM